jgi:regulatory protein
MLDSYSKDIYNRALSLLANREHSKLGLKRKLLQRGFFDDAIDKVLDQLVADGNLSNRRYAECYSRHRCSSGFGPYRVTLELKEEGVSTEIIQQTMASLEESFAESRKRYLAKLAHLEEAVRLKKLWQRGFDCKDDLF